MTGKDIVPDSLNILPCKQCKWESIHRPRTRLLLLYNKHIVERASGQQLGTVMLKLKLNFQGGILICGKLTVCKLSGVTKSGL